MVGEAGEGQQLFDGEAAHEAGLLLQYCQFARDVVAVAGGDVEGIHLDLPALYRGEAGDVRHRYTLGALSLAGARVGAPAKAQLFHLSHHALRPLCGLGPTLRQ